MVKEIIISSSFAKQTDQADEPKDIIEIITYDIHKIMNHMSDLKFSQELCKISIYVHDFNITKYNDLYNLLTLLQFFHRLLSYLKNLKCYYYYYYYYCQKC